MDVTWAKGQQSQREVVLEKLLDEEIGNLPESFAKFHL